MNRITDYSKLKTNITDWMADYMKSSGMNVFVVGVSGGIDSAVVSTLAAETNYNVFALGMPIHQNSEQESLSDAHLKWLSEKYVNVEAVKIDLTNTFDTFTNDLERYATDKHALANTRSRLRMVTLYQFAGQYKGIVVGTGNKVEDYGVGFYTKYGDGGIEAKPTDGLWDDGRTDEDQLGATYSELEEAMETGKGTGLKVLEQYGRMNAHKMNPIPTFTL